VGVGMFRASQALRIAIAAVILAAVIGVGVGPPSSGRGSWFEPPPAHAAGTGGAVTAGTKLMSGFFGTVGESVTSGLTDWGFGWALTALGLTTSEGRTLDEINDNLETIDADLQAIQQQLDAVESKLDALNCIAASDPIDSQIALIRTLGQQYASLTSSDNTVAPSNAEMIGFTNAVLYGGGTVQHPNVTSSVAYALNEIDLALMGGASAGNGVILTCMTSIKDAYVASTGGNPSAAQVVDDQAFYDLVMDELMTLYYGYQTMGAMLVVEAQHFLAACAPGATGACTYPAGLPDPTSATQVCDLTGDDVARACQAARNQVNATFADLRAQFTYAGAPYSNDQVALGWGGAVRHLHIPGADGRLPGERGAVRSRRCGRRLQPRDPLHR
jgi:hypothetical protein